MTNDVRPPGLNLTFRPGTTITFTITGWPAGSLAGRAFEAKLGSEFLDLTINGDVMTVIADDTITDNFLHTIAQFFLNEDIDGTMEPLIIGKWTPSDKARETLTAPTSFDVSAGAVTVTVDVSSGQASVIAHAASRLEHIPRIEFLEHQAAVMRWRQKLAIARSTGGLSVQLVMIGDSMTEGFGGGKYRNRMMDRLRRRFMGNQPGTHGLLPASANVFSQVGDANWPGADDPWTFTGSVTGNIDHGLGFHAANIPSAGAGSATISYFGDKISVFYTRSTGGPTACAVTLDGVSQTVINANGAELPGQSATFGTNAQYGFHTLVMTPNSGTFILEGVEWYDGDLAFLRNNSVILLDGTHAGFGADAWAGQATNAWSAMLAGSDLFLGGIVILLGYNDDQTGRTPTQFQNDLVTIVNRIDARVSSTDAGVLFVMVPGTDLTYVNAARAAAVQLGTDRASVYDLGAMRPDRLWSADLTTDTVHPNEAGNIWFADAMGQVLDPTPISQQPVTPTQLIIDSSRFPTFRSSWTEAWTALTGGIGGYDQSGGGTTVGERRHRIWLDPGTYRVTVTTQEDTGLGTIEALLGRWLGATQSLVSCGTKANVAGSPTVVTTRLSTTVVNEIAGWCPLVIRKTSTTGAIRFVRAVVDKIA